MRCNSLQQIQLSLLNYVAGVLAQLLASLVLLSQGDRPELAKRVLLDPAPLVLVCGLGELIITRDLGVIPGEMADC